MKTFIYTFVAILVILAIKEVKTEIQFSISLKEMADSLSKHPEFIDSIKWYAREDRNGNVSMVPYVDSTEIKKDPATSYKIRHSAPHDIDTTQLFTNHSKIK